MRFARCVLRRACVFMYPTCQRRYIVYIIHVPFSYINNCNEQVLSQQTAKRAHKDIKYVLDTRKYIHWRVRVCARKRQITRANLCIIDVKSVTELIIEITLNIPRCYRRYTPPPSSHVRCACIYLAVARGARCQLIAINAVWCGKHICTNTQYTFVATNPLLECTRLVFRISFVC